MTEPRTAADWLRGLGCCDADGCNLRPDFRQLVDAALAEARAAALLDALPAEPAASDYPAPLDITEDRTLEQRVADGDAPAASGDVEAAWEALADALDAVNSRSFGMRFIVDAERPAIEAAIRAEAGGLDVERLRTVLADDSLCDATDGEHHTPGYIEAVVARLTEAERPFEPRGDFETER